MGLISDILVESRNLLSALTNRNGELNAIFVGSDIMFTYKVTLVDTEDLVTYRCRTDELTLLGLSGAKCRVVYSLLHEVVVSSKSLKELYVNVSSFIEDRMYYNVKSCDIYYDKEQVYTIVSVIDKNNNSSKISYLGVKSSFNSYEIERTINLLNESIKDYNINLYRYKWNVIENYLKKVHQAVSDKLDGEKYSLRFEINSLIYDYLDCLVRDNRHECCLGDKITISLNIDGVDQAIHDDIKIEEILLGKEVNSTQSLIDNLVDFCEKYGKSYYEK